ncbi:MAG TPA: MAPEG family protein [Phenylobacterium sp.]|nr:MAPEG family protein [Phenylobacterium sp.]
MLQPIVALVLWSLVMEVWLYATRIPALQAAKAPLDPNMTAAELNARIPPQVRWKADNYNHLMEQPTIFYATGLVAAVGGHGDAINAGLAWGYVGLRVIHSLVQATANVILLRFSIFMVASVVLAILAVRTALQLV